MSTPQVAVDTNFQAQDAFRATVAVMPRTVDERPAPTSSMRWPVALCFFVAMTSATVAFLTSPLAMHPSIAPYASALNAFVSG